MPTITKSIGTSSRDYSTITLWEADLDNTTPYDAGDDAVGECYNDSAFDESCTVNGGGTIGLNSVTLSVSSGQRHAGIAGTGARMVASAGNRALSLVPLAGTEKLFAQWLEWNCNAQAYTAAAVTAESATTTRVPVINQMIIHGMRTTGANLSMIGGTLTAVARDLRIMNSIAYDAGATGNNRSFGGLCLDSDIADGGCLNNTVHGMFGNGTGAGIGIKIFTDDVDARVRNCIAMGTTTGSGTVTDFLFPGTTNLLSSNNLSSDATADDGGGSNHLISKTTANQFVSLVGGSEDFHLKTGADAIDAGVDLVTTPTGVNLDIDGYDRDAGGVTWDIGADEFIASGRTTKNTRANPLGVEVGMGWRMEP